MAIQAGVGYPQYSGSLISPLFSQNMLEYMYQATVVADITTTEYTSGNLEKFGDELTFQRMSPVNIRPLTKGGTLQHDPVTFIPVKMVIDKGYYSSVPFDMIDKVQIQEFAAREKNVEVSMAKSHASNVDRVVLGGMYAQVNAANKGTTAGLNSGQYNMGITGTPVALTSLSIVEQLAQISAVLAEQGYNDGESKYVVLPSVARPLLLNSPKLVTNAGMAGLSNNPTSQAILNGKLPYQVHGFDIYFTDNVRRQTGTNAYECIAGVKSATAFAMQIEKTEMKERPADGTADFLQSFCVFGSKVLKDEGIVGMVATFA